MARRIRDPKSRQRIVEAAWRVVADNGSHEATVRAIAAELGVSTGFITHYFADKQELMGEVLRFNNERARERLEAVVHRREGLEAVEAALEALLPLDVDRRREWQVWIASWGPAAPGDPLAAQLRDGWRWCERLLAALLEQAEAVGELPRGLDLTYEAERLVATVAGIGLLAGVESPNRVRRKAKRLLAAQLSHLDGFASSAAKRDGNRRLESART
jgi:AcrR family transcriptional regulator